MALVAVLVAVVLCSVVGLAGWVVREALRRAVAVEAYLGAERELLDRERRRGERATLRLAAAQVVRAEQAEADRDRLYVELVQERFAPGTTGGEGFELRAKTPARSTRSNHLGEALIELGDPDDALLNETLSTGASSEVAADALIARLRDAGEEVGADLNGGV